MIHLDSELEKLKNSLLDMWLLVKSQIEKSKEALVNGDADLAREVIAIEKRVNSFELSIDEDSENIFALLSPVASDLRFVLSVIKINNNLERIGDFAYGIAKIAKKTDKKFDEKLIAASRVLEMYTGINEMMDILIDSFTDENSVKARKVFIKDELLDEISDTAQNTIADYIKQNNDNLAEALNMMSIISRLERVGDNLENVAEEIVFYVEAKVLKHKKTKHKIGK